MNIDKFEQARKAKATIDNLQHCIDSVDTTTSVVDSYYRQFLCKESLEAVESIVITDLKHQLFEAEMSFEEL